MKMMQVLIWLRYVLILISILGTLYLVPIDSYVMYTFYSLLFIAIDLAHYKWLRSHYVYDFFCILLKIPFIIYLSMTYEGMLFGLFFSTLFSSYSNKQIYPYTILILLQGIALNYTLLNQALLIVILSNLMYLVIVTTLFLIRYMSTQKEEIEFLYDSLRQHHYELEEARKRLIEYAQKVENVAQIEERNRISKDIHDEIGHKLIRVKMMLEAIIRILPTQQEKGMELIYQVRDHLADGMETLRTTVHQLKPQEYQLQRYSLKQLIIEFAKESGIKVNYQVIGQPFILYPSIEVALYRNAQESMTNALRHGQATEVSIEMTYSPQQILMNIRNNGKIPSSISKGLGFKGMEERVEVLGGSLEIKIGDYFEVQTLLPLHQIS